MKHWLLAGRGENDDTILLYSPDALSRHAPSSRALTYRTRTGALLRVAGVVRGAFDARHTTVVLAPHEHGEVTLEVERSSLPTSGLPPGDGFRWRLLLARAAQTPQPFLTVEPAPDTRARDTRTKRPPGAPWTPPAPGTPPAPRNATAGGLALVGHAHLDVAWLWTYAEAARKAQRTFATAVRQLERDPAFVFTQSQPQLYAFVAERDPAFFERVRTLARAGRFDPSGAAMWVEPDCNLPSGESLLRQLAHGIRWMEEHTGVTPSVAWLPDTFGFPNTLPTLLVHAGIEAFGTTKLAWNDTTVFPYPRFIWEGPDGSRVFAAQIASIEGGLARKRVAAARRRGDLLLVGHGDGGGGADDADVAAAPAVGPWITLAAWFGRMRAAASVKPLPIVRDELYLETHRGTLTTHHALKARHAGLEREIAHAESTLAWAQALHATPFFLDEARRQLAHVWQIVLRAQFHDVLPGTAIPEVFADVHREFDEAEALVAHVIASARSVLPRAPAPPPPAHVEPETRGRDGFVFDNGAFTARVRRDGTLAELRVAGGPNLVRRAARLALYVDRPKRYDAWNLDRDYRRRPRPVRVTGCEIVDGGLEFRYAFGDSLAVARYSAAAGEPFLRLDLGIDWRERHAILRLENELRFAATRLRFGSPHGAVERPAHPRTAAERAKFEAPGQRFARADARTAQGLAVLALDTYGWSAGRARGVTHLGHSLLRGPTWPDPGADRGEQTVSLAFAPFEALGMGELERLWERFAGASRLEVPMFTSDDPAVLVTATKPADDGDGVVVRVRECDGAAREFTLRCGARARDVAGVDALERPVRARAALVDGALHGLLEPFEIRSFRVRLA
jgi:alpha-mannosidase